MGRMDVQIQQTTKSFDLERCDHHMQPESTNPSATILVVDDDKLLLEITGRMLMNAGYVIFAARDGEDAWNVIVENRQKIDLLLTDISMPGAFDGVELADRVRECRPNLPILLMTGISLGDQKSHFRAEIGNPWRFCSDR